MSMAAMVPTVTDADLSAAIQSALAAAHDRAAVVGLYRRPWEYATSAPLEAVEAALDDGRRLDLVLKYVGPHALREEARRVKPAFVLDPEREIQVYRRLLAPLRVGPRLFGSAACPRTRTYWILIERIQGREMYQVGDLTAWQQVARWLALLHRRLAGVDSERVRRQTHLIAYDPEWYAGWMRRAQCLFAAEDPPDSRCSRTALVWLARRYARVVERLASLPPTIIHGEFYPSNVLIVRDGGSPIVVPVDWEMAASGPGVIDLAAFTLGRWREADRRSVIASYLSASDGTGGATLAEMAETIDYAQIHLAIQWLGWFGRRRPPAAHRRDWLSEAVARAETVRL
jgi:hypothetical protein